MTKKHFIQIAAMFSKQWLRTNLTLKETLMLVIMVEEFAEVAAQTNPLFDQDRFYRAAMPDRKQVA
jgi:hypothetical protein